VLQLYPDGTVFKKVNIFFTLICLLAFSLSSLAIAFDDDKPLPYLNRSICKIKNPVSFFSKTKPGKSVLIALNRPELPKPSRVEGILFIREKRVFFSFQFQSFSNRAPPVLS